MTDKDQRLEELQASGETIGQLAEIAASIAFAVEQQDGSTQEISQTIKQVAQSTSHVASSIVEVNDGASETEMASKHLLMSAKTLAAESTKLRAKAQDFLATVRAAG